MLTNSTTNKSHLLLAFLLVLIFLPFCTCSYKKDLSIDGQTISLSSSSPIEKPSILITSNGNIFVTYQSNGNIYLGIYDVSFSPIKEPFIATRITTDEKANVRMIETIQNGVMLVWAGNDNSFFGEISYNIFYNIFTLSGEVEAEDRKVSYHEEPWSSVEFDAVELSGSIVIAWNKVTNDKPSDIQGVMMISDEFMPIGIINKEPQTLQQTGIKLAAFDKGFIAVYLKMDVDNTNVYARILDNEGQVTVDEFQVNTSIGVHASPYVASLANGKFVISWTYVVTNEISARVYNASVNPETLISVCASVSCADSYTTPLNFGGFAITYRKTKTVLSIDNLVNVELDRNLLNKKTSEVYYKVFDRNNDILYDETNISSISGDKTTIAVANDKFDNLYFAYALSNSEIKAEKFSFKNLLTCSDFTVYAKQGSYSIDFNGKLSDELKSPPSYLAFRITDPPTNGKILPSRAINPLIFSIDTSAISEFKYVTTFNNDISDNTCTVTVISCASACETCSQTGTDDVMNCDTCVENYFKKTDDKSSNNCYSRDLPLPRYFYNFDGFYPCYSSCSQCFAMGTERDHYCTQCEVNYYPLEDNPSFCFQSNSIMPNYRFQNDKFVKKEICYETCSVCLEVGTPADHKCLSCSEGYYSLEDRPSMCYLYNDSSVTGYYFNEIGFKKCFDSCTSCTGRGDNEEHSCNKCKPNYVPMEDKLTNCYPNTETFQNYYLDLNTYVFRKCHSACSQCAELGDDNDNKCLSCSYGYANLEDRQSNCIHKDTAMSGYYFDINNNKFTKCYASCKSCNQKGDDENHKCLECRQSFYKPEGRDNCYNTANPVPGYYFDVINETFKNCYKSCYACFNEGSEVDHNCLTCKIDYYNLEDNESQCFPSSMKVQGYKFDNNRFMKCDQKCQQEEMIMTISNKSAFVDTKTINSVLVELSLQPINNDLVSLINMNFQIPDKLDINLLQNTNNFVENYINTSNNTNISPDIFHIIDKAMNYTHKFIDSNNNEEAAIAEYKKTKISLQKLTDMYASKNNTNLFISTGYFEIDVFDFDKINSNQTLNWDSERTSEINIDNECANKLKQANKLDSFSISKLDIKTNSALLNPYIYNQKQNVTGLITNRELEVNAYNPKTGQKLDMATICSDLPMDISFQASDFNTFNANKYSTYKRIGIDIYDKSQFKNCQSFKNNETYADYTTQWINNLTNIAIDCGVNCIYESISNDKTVQCKCKNFLKTNLNIFKQTMSFSVQTTKIDIIRCVTIAFKDGYTISANPSFWFIIILIIFSIIVICLSHYLLDFNKVAKIIIFFQVNFKPSDDKKITLKKNAETNASDNKQTEAELNKQEIIIEEVELEDKLSKEEQQQSVVVNFHENDDKQEVSNVYVDSKDDNVEAVKESTKENTNNQSESNEVVSGEKDNSKSNDGETKADDELLYYYKGRFLKVDINQGTADYCTTTELVKYDKRSYKKYLLDIFLTKHDVGKIFFFPDIFVPKFLIILFFIQVTSVDFALNAILYDDDLINSRNSLQDNVLIL
jgi:hypothetical protein